MNLLIISLAPVVFILLYIYVKDKYEHEPIGMLFKVFFAGAIVTIPIIFIEVWLEGLGQGLDTESKAFYTAFVVAGGTEEFFKFLVFLLLVWRNSNFNESFDGIVYAVFISLGFAAVENIGYVFNFGLQTGFIRAITAVPGHALFGVAMGYYFSIMKFTEEPNPITMLLALLVPIALHGFYDYILMSNYQILLILFIPYLFFLWRYGTKKIHFLSEKSQFKNYKK